MFKRLIPLATLLLLLPFDNAQADVSCIHSQDLGVCQNELSQPDTEASEILSSSRTTEEAQSQSSRPRTCQYRTASVACSTAFGSWVNQLQSWCQRAVPQPPAADPLWLGHEDGHIVTCIRPGGSLIPDPALTYHHWVADAEEADLPDPEDIARRLLAELNLEAPTIGVHPRGETGTKSGIVGWKMWLWANNPTNKQLGPITSSDTESGVTVTLTAEVDHLTWNLGNDDTITCPQGTPWTSARTQGGQNIASPDCTYMYTHRDTYDLSATAHWNVQWSGAGQTGTIPLELTRTRTYNVVEVQSINVYRDN